MNKEQNLNTQERAEFEAWCDDNEYDRAMWLDGTGYRNEKTQRAWAAWQAARRAQLVPEGYALISKDALRAWGKLEIVEQACCYPISAAPQPPSEQQASKKQEGHNALAQLQRRLADADLAARQRELQLLDEIEALERLALRVLKQLGEEAAPQPPAVKESLTPETVNQQLTDPGSFNRVEVGGAVLQKVLTALSRDALDGKEDRAELQLEIMQSVGPATQGLEAQLAAIGAGGVEPLRKTSADTSALRAALEEAEAALEVATSRLSARGANYPVHVTSEARALEIVRQALGKSQPNHFRDATKMA